MLPDMPAFRPLAGWISAEAIPFSVSSPETFNPAVDNLMESLDDSLELLGFGEALHGGEDILILRNRLFQRLVEKHDFSAIVIESSYPRALQVDAYITGQPAAPGAAVPASYEEIQDSGFGHGFGRVLANRELVEWMRDYNADPKHHTKLHFYGFDMPGHMGGPDSPRQVLHFVLDYLASVDASAAQAHRERIDALLSEDSNWENPMLWYDPQKSPSLVSAATALRGETEDLISTLRTRHPELVAFTCEAPYEEALQHATLARNTLTFFVAMARSSDYAASLAVRDALMADNLLHILSRERFQGKVLVFAHNAHLQRGKAEVQIGPQMCSWWPAGSLVDEPLGPSYAVIGTAVGISESNGIGSPEPGSLEALLTASPGPARFIPTYGGEALPESAIQSLPTRSGSKKNPTYVPLTRQAFNDFDWLAVLDSTGSNRVTRNGQASL